MRRIRDLLAVVLLAAAVTATVGAGTAEAKKRKTVRVAVSISLTHVPSGGLDRFSGLVTSPFTRCAQFVGVLLTNSTASSPSGPFTPSVSVVEVDSGPAGTFQIFHEPPFVPPLTVHRYVAQTPQRAFKTRRKKVVCRAGASPPAFAFQPAED